MSGSVNPHRSMRTSGAFRQSAVRYWERWRIAYNLALLAPAVLGYYLYAGVSGGVGDLRRIGAFEVMGLFLLSAIGANLCYSFGYALEFLFGTDAPESRWLRFWRPLVTVLGTFLAMLLAAVGGRNIAWMEYSCQ